LNSFKALGGREFLVILFFKTPSIIKRACFVHPYFFHNLLITLNNLKINTDLSVVTVTVMPSRLAISVSWYPNPDKTGTK